MNLSLSLVYIEVWMYLIPKKQGIIFINLVQSLHHCFYNFSLNKNINSVRIHEITVQYQGSLCFLSIVLFFIVHFWNCKQCYFFIDLYITLCWGSLTCEVKLISLEYCLSVIWWNVPFTCWLPVCVQGKIFFITSDFVPSLIQLFYVSLPLYFPVIFVKAWFLLFTCILLKTEDMH